MLAKCYVCRKRNSENIVKNGHNASGSQHNINVKIATRTVFWNQDAATPKNNASKSSMTIMNVQICAAYNAFLVLAVQHYQNG